MVISGVVIQASPHKVNSVLERINNIEGIDVKDIMGIDKILITLESDNMDEEAVKSREIREIDGVVNVRLAYHHVHH